MRRHLDVGLEDKDVLLGLSELRVDLLDLVFVWAAIELEQRLPLLNRNVFFHQHFGDQRRLGQAWNELDGVLNHDCVRRVRCHEPRPIMKTRKR